MIRPFFTKRIVACTTFIHKNIHITSGEPKTVLKSKFIAHCAKINSREEYGQMISELKNDKKIATATHNISAYRIQIGDELIEQKDDDGENGASDQLLQMLQRFNLTNICVVVTRWYGGINLGANRFRAIRDVAYKVLQPLIKQPENSQKSKK
ncbi:hypothetical protein AKO1_005443 [Acrasis kona]|uniref:Impact N-terminal domain-containing protein n=1 Tax=Acrasis kona TaxID=1008807 RepID=A0AAW2ZKT1_9EUKA